MLSDNHHGLQYPPAGSPDALKPEGLGGRVRDFLFGQIFRAVVGATHVAESVVDTFVDHGSIPLAAPRDENQFRGRVNDELYAGHGRRIENDLSSVKFGLHESAIVWRPELRVGGQVKHLIDLFHGLPHKMRIENGALHKLGAPVDAGRGNEIDHANRVAATEQ